MLIELGSSAHRDRVNSPLAQWVGTWSELTSVSTTSSYLQNHTPKPQGGCVHVQSLSRVWLFVTLWTIVCQAPLSTGCFRQEYWSGLPFPPPRDLSVPGIEPESPALAGGFFTTEPHGKSTGWPDSSQQEPAQSFVLGAFGKGESPS